MSVVYRRTWHWGVLSVLLIGQILLLAEPPSPHTPRTLPDSRGNPVAAITPRPGSHFDASPSTSAAADISITELSPRFASVDGGTVLSITIDGAASAVTASIDETPATVLSGADARSWRIVAPPHAQGAATLTITADTSASTTAAVQYIALPSDGATTTIRQLSLTSLGTEGIARSATRSGSFNASAATSSRYFVFASDTDLGFGAPATGVKLYRRDRSSGTIAFLVDCPLGCSNPYVSEDGSRIAFSRTIAANQIGVFVLDAPFVGAPVRVDVTPAGDPPATATVPFAMSANGQFVAFITGVNLDDDPSDNNNGFDLFVRDLSTGTTERWTTHRSLDPVAPSISEDGRFVTFVSKTPVVAGEHATNRDVYVLDRQVPEIRAVTPANANGEVQGSVTPWLSRDGSTVAFGSAATNLVAEADANGAQVDAYVADVATGAISRVAALTTTLTVSAISPDGRLVAFLPPADPTTPIKLYVHNRDTAETVTVNASSAGIVGDSENIGDVTFAADGNSVIFSSLAANLVAGDTNALSDVFEKTLPWIQKRTPTITWANPAAITYGTALSAAQLNAIADVPGTFAYTPASGAVQPAGQSRALSVTFTPDDQVNYQTATATVLLDVTPAVLLVTPDNKARPALTPNPALTFSVSGFVNGDTSAVVGGAPDLSTTAAADSAPGPYAIIATLGSLTAANYTFTFASGTLQVNQLALSLSPRSVGLGLGASATMTVSMPTTLGNDLVVSLTSSNEQIASVPASVTILAGQTTVTFSASAGVAGTATVTASAAGMTSGTAALNVGTRVVEWITNGSGFWDDGANWSVGSAPATGDVVNIGPQPSGNYTVTIRTGTANIQSLHSTEHLTIAGTLSLSGVASLTGGMTLTGGLAGAGTVLLFGASTWSDGTIQLGGGLEVTAGATLDLPATGNNRLLRGPLTNHGTVVWTAGVLYTHAAGPILNATDGMWQVIGDQSLSGDPFAGSSGTFTNAGMLQRTSGTNSFTVGTPLANTGTIEIQTGVLVVSSAINTGRLTVASGATVNLTNFTLDTGTTFSGGGTLTLNGGMTVNGTVPVTLPFTMIDGSINGTGDLTVQAPMEWRGGFLQGSGHITIAPGATLTLTAGNTRLLRRPMTTQGTVLWTGGDHFLNATGPIVNTGEWRIDGNLTMGSDFFVGNAGTFTNQGVIRRIGGMGPLSIGVPLSNTGTIEIQTGTLAVSNATNLGRLAPSSGAIISLTNFTLDTGTTFSGGGTLTLNGGMTVTGAVPVTLPFTMIDGSINGAGDLTVQAPMEWRGGFLQGSGQITIAPGATLTLTAGNTRMLRRPMTTRGSVVWTGGDHFLNAAGPIVNTGEWRIDGNLTMGSDFFVGNAGTFTNQGVIRRIGGAGPLSMSVPLTNTGTIELQTGTLVVSNATNRGVLAPMNGATISLNNFTLDTGTTFSGGGTLNLNGGLTVTGAVPVTLPFTMIDGSISGAGDLTIQAAMEWRGGFLQGSGQITIAPSGTLTLTAGNTRMLRRPMTTRGTVVWTGGDHFLNASGPIVNTGEWRIDGNLSMGGDFFVGNAGTFTNQGVIRRVAGTGSLSIGVPLTNTGTIELQTGTLIVSNATNRGVLAPMNGATISLNNFTLDTGTTFSGGGTLTLNGNMTVAAPVAITIPLTMVDGQITGDGDLTVQAPMEWRGGYLAGAGQFTLSEGTTLSLTAGNLRLLRRPMTTRGTVVWIGGDQYVNASGPIVNAATGVWEIVGNKGLNGDPFVGNGGSFSNGGTIKMAGAAATLSSALPITNTGTVELRLGGTQSTQFDRLAASGLTLAPGGTLRIRLMNGFVPAGSDQFSVITYSSRNGMFGTLTGDGTYAASYNSNDIVIGAFSTSKLTQAPLSLTGAPASAKVGTTFTVDAQGGSSGLPVVFSVTGGVCTNANGGPQITMTGDNGVCTITATRPGGTDYVDVLSDPVTVLAAPAVGAQVLGGFNGARGGNYNLNNGASLTQFRADLASQARQTQLAFGDVLTPTFLEGIDIALLSSVTSNGTATTPLTSGEQTALHNFVLGGGGAIILVDNDAFAGSPNSSAVNNSFVSPFGLHVTGTDCGPVTGVITAPQNSPVTAGPYGTVSTVPLTCVGWFDNLGPATALGTVTNGQPFLAVIPAGTLGTNSGPVVLISDTAIATEFWNAAYRSLIFNAIAYVAPAAVEDFEINDLAAWTLTGSGWTVGGTTNTSPNLPSVDGVRFARSGVPNGSSGLLAEANVGSATSPAYQVTHQNLVWYGAGWSGPSYDGQSYYQILDENFAVKVQIPTPQSDTWQRLSVNLIDAGFAPGATFYFRAVDGRSSSGYSWMAFDKLTLRNQITSGGTTAQTITVTQPAPAAAAYGSSFTVAATASSGLPVVITTSGQCAITSGGPGSAIIQISSATATCTIHYNQAGDATYSPAPEVTNTTTGQPAAQSITVTTSAPEARGVDTTFSVAATATSSLPVTISATGACSISAGGAGSATVLTGGAVGTCTIHYNQPGDTNYSAAPEVLNTTTVTAGNVISWSRDGNGSWDDPTAWSLGRIPAAGDIVTIDRASGTYVVTIPSTTAAVQSLTAAENLVITGTLAIAGTASMSGATTLSGGLSGPGAATIDGTMTWTSGTINIRGGLTVAPAGLLTIESGNGHLLTDSLLRTLGSVQWTGGSLLFSSGGSISTGVVNESTGVWTVENDLAVDYGGGAAGGTFTNNGTLRRASGSGAFSIRQSFFNTGSLALQTGSLNVTGLTNSGRVDVSSGATFFLNAVTFQTGTTFAGAGLLHMNGTTSIANDLTITLRTLLTDTVNGAGRLTMGAPLTWSSGTINLPAGLEIPDGQTLTMDTGNSHRLIDTMLHTFGTVQWTDGPLLFTSGGTIPTGVSNQATGRWYIDGNLTIGYGGGAAGGTVTNAGLLRRQSGSGAFTIDQGFTNTGTIELQSGTMNVTTTTNSGLIRLSDDTTFFLNAVTFQSGSSFAGTGLLHMNGTTTIANDLTITLRTLLTQTVNGAGKLTMGAPLTWSSGTINLPAGLEIPSGQALTIETGNSHRLIDSMLRTFGTVQWTDGPLLFTSGGTIPTGVMNEATGRWYIDGNLTIGYGGGAAGGTVTNAGLLRRQSGSGAFTIDQGFTNTGTIELQSGTMNVTTTTNSGLLNLSALTTFFANAVTFQSSSTFAGSGLLHMNGTTTIAGNLTVTLPTLLTNTVNGPGKLTMGAPLTWSSGTVNLPAGLEIPFGQTLTIDSGNGHLLLDSTLRTMGSVQWTGGSLAFTSGGSIATGVVNETTGVWTLQGDRNADYGGGAAGGTFVNRGTLTRTGAAGSYSSNQLLDNSGTIVLRLGGTGAGQYDRISAAGMNVTGTLDVRLMNGFLPTASDQFTVLTFNSRSGVFGNILGNGYSYVPTYTGSSLVLGNAGAVTPSFCDASAVAAGIINTFAGSGPAGIFNGGFSGDGGAATSARFNLPRAIAAGNGGIYVADSSNFRIRKIDLATCVVQTVAGAQPFSPDFPGDVGDGRQATSALVQPTGVAVDGNSLYIADKNNYRIRRVDLTTGLISTVAGTGTAGFSGDGGPATSAQLNQPWQIAVADGVLYVADTLNHRVRAVDLSTGIIQTVAGNGTAGFSGDGGPATAATLNQPTDLTVSRGVLYIANIASVRAVNLFTGIITTVAGNGVTGTTGDGGPATAARVSPNGIAIKDNTLFIASNTHTVRRVDLTANTISALAGTANTSGFSGDGGQAASAILDFPHFLLVLDRALFIDDTFNHRIRRIQLRQTQSALTVSAQPTAIYGATFTPSVSGGSGAGPVTLLVSGVCTTDGTSVTMTSGTGMCTITAAKAADADYEDILSAPVTVTAAKASATLTLSDLTQAYDGTPKAVTVATNPAALAVVTVTYDGSETAPTASGSYAVVASLNNLNYSAANATGTLTITAPPAASAPVRWRTIDGGNGHWYQIVTVPAGITWDAAQTDALARGGYLATAITAAENSFVFGLVDAPSYWKPADGANLGPWLGGYQQPQSPEPGGGWTWVNSGGPFTFTNWHSGEPNDGVGGPTGFPESRLHYFEYGAARAGVWNDLPATGSCNSACPIAYVVEYDSLQYSFDAAADFSIQAGNPNGAWTYGRTPTLGGTFTPFSVTTANLQGVAGIPSWMGPEPAFGNGYPNVSKNVTAALVTMSGAVQYLPGQLMMHPSGSGAFSVVRFTAPVSGSFALHSVFEGRDDRTTTTDVHVLVNGVSMFDGLINGFGPATDQVLNTTLTLTAGDVVDFVVGYGANQTFLQDSTSLVATLSLTPDQTPQAALTITGVPATAVYGTSFTVGTTGGSGTGAVTFAASGACSNTNGGALITIASGTGTCTIVATKAADATYAAAMSPAVSVTASRATLQVKADDKNKVAGTANPALTYTVSGFVLNETANVLTGAPALSTPADLSSPAGTYPITITTGTLAAANYAFTFVNGVLTVAPAPVFLCDPQLALAIGSIYTFAGSGDPSLGGGFSGDGGPATAAQMNLPSALAWTNTALYIADSNNHRVRRVNLTTCAIDTVAGNGTAGFLGDNGPAVNARLNNPRGVAAASGFLYISDTNNHRIRRVDLSTGTITTIAGSNEFTFNGDGIPASTAALNGPAQLTVANGSLFFADSGYHRVRRIDLTTGLIDTVAGNGNSAFAGDGGPAVNASLNFPRGVAVGNGAVYIADSQNARVRRVDLATGVITTIAGSGSFGVGGDNIPATFATIGPYGLALDGTMLYVADQAAHRARRIDLQTQIITTMSGTGTSGFAGDDGPGTSARLQNPSDVLVAGDALFVADTFNQRVRRVQLQHFQAPLLITGEPGSAAFGTFFTVGISGGSGTGGVSFATNGACSNRGADITMVAGTGTCVITAIKAGDADYRPATATASVTAQKAAQAAVSVTAAPSNAAYATQFTVGYAGGSGTGTVSFAATGACAVDSGSTIAMTSGTGICSITATKAADGNYQSATSVPVTVAAAKQVLQVKADDKEKVARSANPSFTYTITGFVLNDTASVLSGTPSLTTTADQGSPAGTYPIAITAGTLTSPNYSFTFVNGVLTVTVFLCDPQLSLAIGTIHTFAGSAGASVDGGGFGGDGGVAPAARLNLPSGLTADDGGLYIADANNHRIRRVDLTTCAISTVAGTGTAGFFGDSGSALNAQLNNPSGVAVSGGSLYISDTNNHRIRRVDLATGTISTVAGSSEFTFNGDGIPANTANLNAPAQLTVADGSLYLADAADHRVRRIDLATGIIFGVAGNGASGFGGDGGPATDATLNFPRGVAVGNGAVFIGDYQNARVRRVDLATGLISTIAGTGSFGIGADNVLATASEIGPYGVALDGTTLYVADQASHRVRRIDLQSHIISTVAGTGTSGFTGDNGPGTSARLQNPNGVFVAGEALFVADTFNQRVRRVQLQYFQAPLLITGAPASAVFGTVFTVGVSGGSGTGPVTFAATGACNNMNGGAEVTMTTGTGTCAITATKAGDADYRPATATASVTAQKASPAALSITGAPASAVYGTQFTVGYDGGSGSGAVSFAATGACTTGGGSTMTMTSGTGLCSIVATKASDADYVEVSSPAALVTAEKAAPQLTWADPASIVYGTALGATQLNATASVAGSFSYTPAAGTYLQASAAQPLSVLFTPDDGANYTSASASVQISVTPALLQVRADDKVKVIGAVNPVLTFTTTGFLLGDTPAVLSGAPLLGTTAVTTSGLGTYPIAITPGTLSAANYGFTFANGILAVVPPFLCDPQLTIASGTIFTFAGSGPGGFSAGGFGGDGGQATAALMKLPTAVAVANGFAYIADTQNNRVRRVNMATCAIDTFAGTGAFGSSGDGGPATNASLNAPRGLAVANGSLYIGQSNDGRIRRVDLSTGTISTVPGTVGLSPFRFTVANGKLWVADRGANRVVSIDLQTAAQTVIAGTGTGGYSGDGGAATAAQLNLPEDVVVRNNEIYIADRQNARVRRVDLATGVITTVAGTGSFGASTATGPATSVSIAPTGLVLDGGALLIADTGSSTNQRVRRLDLVTGTITTVVGNGAAGFAGDGGPGIDALLDNPAGLSVSGDRLWFADQNNQRIRQVQLEPAQAPLSVINAPATAVFNTSFVVSSTGGSGGGAVVFRVSGPCSNVNGGATITMTGGTGTCSLTAIKAGDATYRSVISAVVSVGALLGPPPAAPTGLAATANSANQITLTWLDNATTEDGYKIERSPVNTSAFVQVATTMANATSFVDNGLNGATKYYYRIRAYSVNTTGDSAYSNVVNATTLAPPAQPTGLTATPVSSSQINLTWTDRSNNELGFKISRSTDGTTFVQIATVGANVFTYSDSSGLSPATSYSYVVRSYNAIGDSLPSNAATIATLPLPPAAPTALTVTGFTYQDVTLAWTDNSNNEAGFRIERSTDGATFTLVTTVGANVTTYVNGGLTASTNYFYRVRSTNTGGDSSYSNTVTVTTPPPPPAAPTNLIASASNGLRITLTWVRNSANEQGFKIERSLDGTTFTEIAIVGPGITTFVNTGLAASTNYYYRIRAFNEDGNSGYSNIAIAKTKAK